MTPLITLIRLISFSRLRNCGVYDAGRGPRHAKAATRAEARTDSLTVFIPGGDGLGNPLALTQGNRAADLGIRRNHGLSCTFSASAAVPDS